MTAKNKGAGAKVGTPAEEPEVTQEPATAPVRRDGNGFEIDEWDLPVSGPARANRLAELDMPDPHDDAKAWKPEKRGSAGDDANLNSPPLTGPIVPNTGDQTNG